MPGNLNPFLFQFREDLDQLIRELEAFPEQRLWQASGSMPNSAGILFRHLTGNLRHFIGHYMGQNAYTRERDREFSEQGLPKAFVLQELRLAQSIVLEVLENMPVAQLDQPFPAPEFARLNPTYGQALLKLSAHLAYHLGQINALRRLGPAE